MDYIYSYMKIIYDPLFSNIYDDIFFSIVFETYNIFSSNTVKEYKYVISILFNKYNIDDNIKSNILSFLTDEI